MRVFAIAAAALLLSSTAALADEEYKNCSIAPASQISFSEDLKTPGECAKSCAETEGCIAWSFRPHSFDKEKPGLCKLIDKVFKVEESAKSFCGEM